MSYGINIPGNVNFPFGTGQFEDLTGGLSQPSNFFGMAGWWTVPQSWYSRTDANGQIFVSPNSNFTTPVYAVKINQNGEWVYFDMARNGQNGNLRPYYD